MAIRKHELELAETIENAVGGYFNLTAVELHLKKKSPDIVRARFAVWYILRTWAGWSYPKIAYLYAKDHTTVIYGVQAVTKDRFAVDEVVEILYILKAVVDIENLLSDRSPLFV